MLIVVWEFVDRDLQQEDADDAWWKEAWAPAPCIDLFFDFFESSYSALGVIFTFRHCVRQTTPSPGSEM